MWARSGAPWKFIGIEGALSSWVFISRASLTSPREVLAAQCGLRATHIKARCRTDGSGATFVIEFLTRRYGAVISHAGYRTPAWHRRPLPCGMYLQHEKCGSPVHYCYFEQPRLSKRDGNAGPDVGAVHSGEIEHALSNLDGNRVYAWTATDQLASVVVLGYFVNVIKTGNPNGPGLPHWPDVAKRGGGLLRQAFGAGTHSQVDRDAARYEFLQRVDPDVDL